MKNHINMKSWKTKMPKIRNGNTLFTIALAAVFSLCNIPLNARSVSNDNAKSINSIQQRNEIRGTIVSESGEPMIGVSVLIKGTSFGTVTDLNGKYILKDLSSSTNTITVSYIGYITQNIRITNQKNITIVLKEDTKTLDEVVVVGYGSVKKRDLTGSVSSVGSDKLKGRSFGNALQSMAGQVSGVMITQTQGAPGMAPTIKVRGATSINAGTTPLYVIDGVPMEDDTDSGNGSNGGNLKVSNHNPMNNINPNDIESIEVLKDAASAAIYGSRGANGVVLITTKEGKAGKTNVDITYEYGLSKVNRRLDLMNGPQWIEYESAARNNQFATDYAANPKLQRTNNSKYVVPVEFSDKEWIDRIGNGTDWQDVLYRTGISHNAQASVSGGNDKTRFMMSLGYLKQKGVVITNDYDRISMRTNINHKINDRFSVAVKANLSRTKDSPQGLAGKSDVVSLACQSDPIFPKYVETGNLGFKDPESIWYTFVKYGFQLWHPYSLTYETSKKQTTSNMLGTAIAEYKLFDGLTFKSSASMNTQETQYEYYWNKGQKYGYSGYMPAIGTYSNRKLENWIWENTLNYNKTFNNVHNVTGLVGYSMQDQMISFATMTGNGFPNDMVHTLNASTTQTGSTDKSEWALLSYLARATYSYKGKYLASASIRADGCSRFGSNNRWGYFPSGSIAWRMSEENFMKSLTWLDNLKLRFSYGVTGNNQIADYASIGLLSTSQYYVNGNYESGLRTSTLPSADLKWEKTGQYNLGADFGLFKNRLNLTVDLYYSKTTDMLLKVPVPVLTGFTDSQTNIGSVRNKGIEVGINTVNVRTKSFTWTTDFNISANRNKVLHLGNNDAPIELNTNSAISRTEVGQPVGNYYGYKVIGVYSTADINDASVPKYKGAEPGDPKVKDVSGDNVIDTKDRTILGNYQPDYTWGMTNNFSYKGLELSVMLTGTEGNEIMNQNARFIGFYLGARNLYASRSNFWKSDADPGDGMTPKPRTTPNMIESNCSSMWVEDGSFVRIKNIRVGYNLPTSLVKKLSMNSLKLYVNMENVHVFSDYSNYDPEGSTFQTGYRVGFDYGAYPNPFTCTFGVNIGF